MIGFSTQAIREEIAENFANAQALTALAEQEERDFTPEEQQQFEEILNVIGEDGDEPTGLYAKLRQADKFQQIKLRLNNVSNDVPTMMRNVPARPRLSFEPSTLPLKHFKGENAKQDAFDCGMWFKAALLDNKTAQQYCTDNGIDLVPNRDVSNAHTIGDPTKGGYTVPKPLSDAIIDVRRLTGVTRQVVRQTPMTSNTLDVPKRAGGLTVYYPGEAGSITESDKEWGNVALAAVKRAVLSKSSNELIADSIINVMDDLAGEIGHALALQEDNEFINGDGTATYGGETGLLSAIGDGGKVTLAVASTWDTTTLADFSAVKAKLPEKYMARAVWIMSREYWSAVAEKLVYAAGGNTTSNIEGMVMPMLLGHPVYYTDWMPADAADSCQCFFGSFFDAVLMGDRAQVTIATSEDYAFDEDVTTIRGTTRYDIDVHEPGTVSTAGAYVGLYNGAAS